MQIEVPVAVELRGLLRLKCLGTVVVEERAVLVVLPDARGLKRPLDRASRSIFCGY